jgi:RNA polymerase sigma factor (sigma-70 family)
MQHYLNHAGRIPLLTAEEEILLGRAVQARQKILTENPKGPYTREERRALRLGKKAEERMTTANMRLVSNAVRGCMRKCCSLTKEDLLQEGTLGLIEGVKKFDPERGYKFSTYAYWWIRQAISRAITSKDRTIRLPVNAHDSIVNLKKWVAEQKRSPTVKECAEFLNVKEETARGYLISIQDVRSLDEKCSGKDGEASSLIDLIQDDREVPWEIVVENLKDQMEWVESRMFVLTDMEKTVVRTRLTGEYVTTRAIADKLGVHRSYVTDIERRAVKKLKQELNRGLS